ANFAVLDLVGAAVSLDLDPRRRQGIEVAADAPAHSGPLEGVRQGALLGFHVSVARAVRFPDPLVVQLEADLADGLAVGVGVAALPAAGAADGVEPIHPVAGVDER